MNTARARHHLKQFDLTSLFIEELGWDSYKISLTVIIDNITYPLQAVAEKRGVVVFRCLQLPLYTTRRKIEREVAKSFREHILIYTEGSEQIWQWVRREIGRPLASREHRYDTSQSGDSLLQKLAAISFSLAEEESLTLVDVTSRVRAAFNVERATKKFYEQFKKEHTAFEKFVLGIPDVEMGKWYVSVMLNRLMFVYFIQRKGFLDGDPDYLRNRLRQMQQQHGQDQFYSFYRYFLLRLFHDGLGQPDHTPELEKLLGKVPYLNGGIFQLHQIEQQYPDIQISDEAFGRIFDFFDQYQWHLDDRPLHNDREINPDVLGYIFEKYINNKEMGAYYTKEDITEYIGRNTIIPFLFDEAQKGCAVAFSGENNVWTLAQTDPDRYIYPAVRKGVELPLLSEIVAGVHDANQRGNWNTPASEAYALPTEIWRETVARRQRYEEVRLKLAKGEVQSINDFITYNLDIQQFAQDVIENCEGADLLQAFWRAITRVSVLDPTCGSGAFLFAALNILQPLYEAAVERMRAFLAESEWVKLHPRYAEFFGRVMAQLNQHPNQSYYILKSIMVNNLYGVDFMPEAVEIARLRLFLKLVAQVEIVDQIEPLPDIDFNIRAGNTLVGFTTREEVAKALQTTYSGQGRLLFGEDQAALAQIEEKAADIDRLFTTFRKMQTGGDLQPFSAADFVATKNRLQNRLKELEGELNQALARQYGVDPSEPAKYQKWQTGHQPFHWFIEFYGILKQGGFDVIIGNPPWKEYSSVKRLYEARNYITEKSGNLYSLCIERGLRLRCSQGLVSFIVQLPLTSSSRMLLTRNLLRSQSDSLFVIPFDDRPGKLFNGLQHCRSTIFFSKGSFPPNLLAPLFVTRYHRWPSEIRDYLFEQVEYAETTANSLYPEQFPKYANRIHQSVFQKVKLAGKHKVGLSCIRQITEQYIFYQEATQYWVKAVVGLPFYAKNGLVGAPAHGRYLYFEQIDVAYGVCALLNSSLFYLYFVTYGDCFHLSHTLVEGFPVPSNLFYDRELVQLSRKLIENLKANAERKIIDTKTGDKIAYDEFYAAKSKNLLDQIDLVLAKHYGFTDEELDFIINYDIKYRLGDDLFDDDDSGA